MEKLLEELRLIRQAVEHLTVGDTRTPVDDTRTTIHVWRDNRGYWNAETETKFGIYRATDVTAGSATVTVCKSAGIDTLDRKA